jgi:ubiquinone/menaquinone biosynthesis C-methylase UbiE
MGVGVKRFRKIESCESFCQKSQQEDMTRSNTGDKIHSPMTAAFQYQTSDIDKRYDRGRQPLPAALAELAADLRLHAPPQVKRVLDLGCGTGRYSALLAGTFGVTVVALEPAANMLRAAVAKRTTGTRFIRASAQAIPLDDAVIDLVFISQVLHHLHEMDAVMTEIRCVLSTGGRLFVRQSTRENLDSYSYQRFFPAARAIDEKRLPTRVQIIDAAASARLAAPQLRCRTSNASGQQYLQKIATRSNSDLAMIPDDEFVRGLEDFTCYLNAHPNHVWSEEIDHLVFTAI